MSDMVLLAIGFVIGWIIRAEVQFWIDLSLAKVRREAIRNEPSTVRVMENIIWAKLPDEDAGRKAGIAAAKAFNDMSGNAGRLH